MGMTITYNFTNSLNYTYDNIKISIAANLVKLLLQSASLPFTQPFTSDVGFTYDNTKAEFVGGKVQQKSQIPTNNTCGATYTNNINLNTGDGVLTGIGFGTPTVSGGKLDLTGGTKYVEYAGAGNANSPQVGCFRFKFTPNYSGAPGTTQMLFSNHRTAGSLINLIMLYQNTARNMLLSIYDSIGAAIMTPNLGLWSQNAGQEYEFELNYDITTGATRLFIDGVQHGTTQTGTGTRDINISFLKIGADYNGSNRVNGYFDDLQVFSTVQHTTNYAPGYVVPEYTYTANNVVLPEMEHTGDGSILAFDEFSTTESGSPRYTLQIGRSGDYLYWNGAVWAVSNNTYAQSNDKTTFDANVGSLPVSGEKYGQFMILFTDSNIISDVDILTATMTVNNGYLTTNPSLLTNSGFRADQLLSFSAVESKTGLDEVKYTLLKDSVDYYWNGTAWTVSNGTYSQANTATQINTNKSSFLTEGSGKNVKIRPFLHSETGITTPSITSFTVEYDFSGELPTLITVTIWGYLRDLLTYVEGQTIQVKPAWTIGDKTIIEGVYKDIVSSTEGYFEIDTVIEDVVPTYLIWKIGTKIYKTNFVNQSTVKFSELTILEQNGG